MVPNSVKAEVMGVSITPRVKMAVVNSCKSSDMSARMHWIYKTGIQITHLVIVIHQFLQEKEVLE